MKTKFLLHGGGLSQNSEHNDRFFREFAKDLQDGDVVLWVGFARLDPDNRAETFKRDKELILAQADKDIVVENAEYETLLEQVKEAKAVFVTGGMTRALMHDFVHYGEDLQSALAGKIYAGSSAGAQVLARYFHLCQENQPIEGMNWLPIRLIVHYGNEDFNGTDEALEKLKKYPPGTKKKGSIETVVLPECQWVAMEVDLSK